MHKILINKAFGKAKTERKKLGDKKPSLTHMAEHLALFVKESKGMSLDERSYRNYYSEAKAIVNTDEDISINQITVINGLAEFLGYANYEEFTNSLVGKSLYKLLSDFLKKNKVGVIILLMLLGILFVYYSINRQRWMVWQENYYIEVKFDAEKLSNGFLKLYNEDRIKHFKKIDADCNTEFFGLNNEVKIWYGKNSKKELEYFTALGLHPETGKTLHPITVYMIRKYICDAY